MNPRNIRLTALALATLVQTTLALPGTAASLSALHTSNCYLGLLT